MIRLPLAPARVQTLVLNLLLYGCENWVLTAPLR
jgi:hypothetical protein